MRKKKKYNTEWLCCAKWYVLWHNSNSDKIEMYNIFNSSHFLNSIPELLENYITFEDFKSKLAGELFYAYCSKAEYEILCAGLFHKEENVAKIDIYYQVLPNIDILAKYIIDLYNNRKYARKLIEA